MVANNGRPTSRYAALAAQRGPSPRHGDIAARQCFGLMLAKRQLRECLIVRSRLFNLQLGTSLNCCSYFSKRAVGRVRRLRWCLPCNKLFGEPPFLLRLRISKHTGLTVGQGVPHDEGIVLQPEEPTNERTSQSSFVALFSPQPPCRRMVRMNGVLAVVRHYQLHSGESTNMYVRSLLSSLPCLP